ncbi:hypothetical protein U1701_07410 [Sphingomonas sp. PB2P19]|uniref:hypothetical protein n=1 Tax=Sphingomonas rhamnosi TaxID=3096156 RepID=UPI002FC79068
MTAIGVADASPSVVDVQPAPSPASHGDCDFSGDGRIDHRAADRSALASPGFYPAVVACLLLFAAVLMVRLCCCVSRLLRRGS